MLSATLSKCVSESDLAVSSSVPCQSCQGLSDYVIHSHFASGLPFLLSLVCAFCGLTAGSAHRALFQVLAAPLMHSFCVLRPDMPLCYLACVLVCSYQGRVSQHVPSCFVHHVHAALFPHYSCAAAHLHQAGCSDLAAAKPSSIPLLCACSLTLCVDCSFCCMRWMPSFAQLLCNGFWRLLLVCLVCFPCFHFHYLHL